MIAVLVVVGLCAAFVGFAVGWRLQAQRWAIAAHPIDAVIEHDADRFWVVRDGDFTKAVSLYHSMRGVRGGLVEDAQFLLSFSSDEQREAWNAGFDRAKCLFGGEAS